MKPLIKYPSLSLEQIQWGKTILIGIVLLWFLIIILFPLAGILQKVIENGLPLFLSSLTTETSRHAFTMTFWITLICVVANTLFGVIVSLVIVKQKFHGKWILEGFIDLPFAVSPVVAGFMLILLYGPHGWIGHLANSHGIKIIYAFPGMLLATLFVTLPFVIREVIPVLKEFGIQQEESAYVLGASRWQAFWRVTLPSIKWGLAYGITLTIARSIGEFGAILVVSGSIIRKTQTATLHIHQQFTDLDYAGAFAAAIVLAFSSFLILTIVQHINKRKGV